MIDIKKEYNSILVKEGISKTKDLPELVGKTYQAVQKQLTPNIKMSVLEDLLKPIGYRLEIKFVKDNNKNE